MRDLNINELEQVYGAGGKSKRGCGSSPTPPSCGGGSKSKKSKSKKSKGKKSKSNKRGSRGYC